MWVEGEERGGGVEELRSPLTNRPPQQHWPVLSKAKFKMLVGGTDGAPDEWIEEDIGMINMVITNMRKLGVDHPIVEGASERATERDMSCDHPTPRPSHHLPSLPPPCRARAG